MRVIVIIQIGFVWLEPLRGFSSDDNRGLSFRLAFTDFQVLPDEQAE